MSTKRLKSIVPMYGGATQYVETLDDILDFVRAHNPTTDEIIGWHRGSFPQVSSQDSIMRRVQYLQQVGFIDQKDNQWTIDELGNEYLNNRELKRLLEIMCDRNVGLRSLLYELSSGPMTLEEINAQQLNTHPELGWNPEKTDMAKQRTNWLRSMDAVERTNGNYQLTEQGRSFISQAIGEWASAEQLTSAENEFDAGTYETTVQARAVDPEFRASALSRYEHECPISGVDHPRLLDVAHVLPWSEYPDHRADLSNVVVLSKTHHAAFDQGFFTIDQNYTLQVNPDFTTQSDLLRQTICSQDGERVPTLKEQLNDDYVAQHNAELNWV